MTNFMVRVAKDDFDALLVCQAMTACGLVVASVTPFRNQLHVFARGEPNGSEIDCDKVDAAIDATRERH